MSRLGAPRRPPTDASMLVKDAHADVVPACSPGDVLVSDASSIIFEFLALDRPIVLVTNPRRRAGPRLAR